MTMRKNDNFLATATSFPKNRLKLRHLSTDGIIPIHPHPIPIPRLLPLQSVWNIQSSRATLSTKQKLPPIPSLWSQLPQDILHYIYDEHFNVKKRFDAMMAVFRSLPCRMLYHTELTPFIREMFTANRELLMYTLKHLRNDVDNADGQQHYPYHGGDTFMTTYKMFNEKGAGSYFPLITCKFERFALAWLLCEYH